MARPEIAMTNPPAKMKLVWRWVSGSIQAPAKASTVSPVNGAKRQTATEGAGQFPPGGQGGDGTGGVHGLSQRTLKQRDDR